MNADETIFKERMQYLKIKCIFVSNIIIVMELYVYIQTKIVKNIKCTLRKNSAQKISFKLILTKN